MEVRIPIGEKACSRSNPSGGWKLECLCGFFLLKMDLKKQELESAYT
jgi:hypothetical protein